MFWSTPPPHPPEESFNVEPWDWNHLLEGSRTWSLPRRGYLNHGAVAAAAPGGSPGAGTAGAFRRPSSESSLALSPRPVPHGPEGIVGPCLNQPGQQALGTVTQSGPHPRAGGRLLHAHGLRERFRFPLQDHVTFMQPPPAPAPPRQRQRPGVPQHTQGFLHVSLGVLWSQGHAPPTMGQVQHPPKQPQRVYEALSCPPSTGHLRRSALSQWLVGIEHLAHSGDLPTSRPSLPSFSPHPPSPPLP